MYVSMSSSRQEEREERGRRSSYQGKNLKTREMHLPVQLSVHKLYEKKKKGTEGL